MPKGSSVRDENYAIAIMASNLLGTAPIYLTGVNLTDAHALHVAIVDLNGDQVSSFGGGTQYTDGAAAPANPVGNTIEWNEGGTWRTVSTAKPLPVTATFSPSGTQDVNLTKVAGSAIALGQALAAASLPVVLTAAQITTLTPLSSVAVTNVGAFATQSTITDGTNTANILKSDGTVVGQNAVITAGTHLAAAFTTTSAQAVATTDAANYGWVSVQITGQGGTSTVTFQGSNDNSTWVSVVLELSTATNTVGVSSTTATGVWHGPLPTRYFRLNVTGIASGTTAGTVEFFTNPKGLNSVGVAAGQQGTWTVQPGNTANTTAWLVGGGTATNVAITDNPLNLGAQAVSSENAAVTTARKVQLIADLVGKLIVLPYANPENFVSGAITSAMTGTTSTSLLAAPAAGLRNYITQITVSNSHATVGTDVIIQDGSGGTILYTIPAAAAYGGASITFPVPLRQPTTATAIFCANVTTGSNIKVSASGYKGA